MQNIHMLSTQLRTETTTAFAFIKKEEDLLYGTINNTRRKTVVIENQIFCSQRKNLYIVFTFSKFIACLPIALKYQKQLQLILPTFHALLVLV